MTRRFCASVKHRMMQEQDFRCFYCSVELQYIPKDTDDKNRSRSWATLDHKIPISKGGEHTLKNCVIACRSCNFSKGTKTDTEFMAVRHGD